MSETNADASKQGFRLPTWIRWLFGALSILFLVLSWPAAARAATYASVLVAGSFILSIQAITGRTITSLKMGPAEVGLPLEPEGAAAAEVASTRQVYSARVDSDDSGPPTPSDEDPLVEGSLNYSVAYIALTAIINEATQPGTPLESCTIRIYTPDADFMALRQILGPEEGRLDWKPGTGATGAAFDSLEYQLAVGEAVWNEDFGVDASRIEELKGITAVAAFPICNNAGNKCIAVVTASTEQPDPLLATEAGKLALIESGLLMSRVFIDLLFWLDDD